MNRGPTMTTELSYPPPFPQGQQPVFMNHQYNPYPVQAAVEVSPVNEKKTGQKVKIAFYLAVLFALLSYHGTYRAMNMIYASFTSQPFEIQSETGCPTTKGVLLHSVIFFLAVMFLLNSF